MGSACRTCVSFGASTISRTAAGVLGTLAVCLRAVNAPRRHGRPAAHKQRRAQQRARAAGRVALAPPRQQHRLPGQLGHVVCRQARLPPTINPKTPEPSPAAGTPCLARVNIPLPEATPRSRATVPTLYPARRAGLPAGIWHALAGQGRQTCLKQYRLSVNTPTSSAARRACLPPASGMPWLAKVNTPCMMGP